MKNFVLFSFLVGLLFVFGACNDPGDPSTWPGTGGEGGEVELTPNGVYVLNNQGGTWAATIDLNENGPSGILDVSNYAYVTVTATLYQDTEGTIPATQEQYQTAFDDSYGSLGKFKLLKVNSDWEDSGNRCGETKYQMIVNGNNVLSFNPTDSGVPGFLLLETEYNDVVKAIGVSSIVFSPRESDVAFKPVYGESYVTASGNKIIFNNATYSDGAVLFEFPATFPANLAGRKLVFAFKLENTTQIEGLEHQIHVQAADGTTNFNGKNPTAPNAGGQQYITLDDHNPEGQYSQTFDEDTQTGTFKVPLDWLITASQVTGDANDIKGPFELTAIRIVNNGTVWEGHTRDKSYTLIFDSITVE